MTLLVCLRLPFGVAKANAATDGEMWNEVDVSARLTARATLTVPIVVRNSFSLQDPQLVGVGPLVDVALSKRLTMTAGYLFVDLPNAGKGLAVHVPLGAITIGQGIGRLRLNDRNRVEVLVGAPQSPIRYRNKLLLSAPFSHENWMPFVSDEIFYDFSRSNWSQNRFQAGLGKQVSPQIRIDLFYMERNVHHSAPAASHIVGITFQIKLRKNTFRRGLPHEEN